MEKYRNTLKILYFVAFLHISESSDDCIELLFLRIL